MKIGELFFELGFKADTVQLNEVASLIGRLNLSSFLASLGVKELYDGLRNVLGIAEKTAMDMNLFGKETGLSSQKMTQWTRFAEQMGVSGETVGSTLIGLQKKLVGLKLGTDQSLLTPFYILNQAGAGITGNETPFELMEKFLGTVKKLDPALRTTVADMMGINTQLLAMDSFKGADLIPVPSTEQIQAIMNYHKAIVDLGNTWKNIWEGVGASLAPIVEGLATAAKSFVDLAKNSETFAGYLKGIGIAIAAMVAVTSGPIGAITFLVTSLLALIGQLVHYGPQLQSLIPHLDLKGFKADIQNFFNPGLAAPVPVGQSSSLSQTNSFHITSNNPEEVGKKVHDVIKELLSDAQYQQPLTTR